MRLLTQVNAQGPASLKELRQGRGAVLCIYPESLAKGLTENALSPGAFRQEIS
ncbi:hypothetical protein HDIA_4741 [Hartmannibacter diazotrophicus]|uniref:Uncharacterized protein n=1 Tax=Hartmannibacter diazotrophicus TaxID=1482074 RepID=A0A2C9DD66_9HYPH|nr:hypothetical protein HDIA_4741 [Hartmannibacter diazotrophicus]